MQIDQLQSNTDEYGQVEYSAEIFAYGSRGRSSGYRDGHSSWGRVDHNRGRGGRGFPQIPPVHLPVPISQAAAAPGFPHPTPNNYNCYQCGLFRHVARECIAKKFKGC